MKTTTWMIACAFVFTFSAASTAAAQDGPKPKKGRHGAARACKADVEKFCAGVDGKRAKVACLLEKEAQLSTGCRTVITKRKKRLEAALDACGDDVDTYCSEYDEPREIRRCLAENREALSTTCQDFMAEKRGKRHKHKKKKR